MNEPPTESTWTPLCPLADVPADRGRYIMHGRRSLAIFRNGGEQDAVYVMDDTCPHAGASLSIGLIHDDCIVCPWHGWAFRFEDGRCPDNPAVGVNTYPARVVDGTVQVQLGPPTSMTP